MTHKPASTHWLITTLLLSAIVSGCQSKKGVVLGPVTAISAKGLVHKFTFQVLSEQAAVPGKVIRASSGGRELASYTCSPDDAAVALVYVTDSNKTSMIGYATGPAVDSQGRHYTTSFKATDAFCFVSILKGYATAGAAVSVPLRVYSVRPITSATPVIHQIVFTHLPPPTRVISPPTGALLAVNESIGVAKTYGDSGEVVVDFKNKVLADYEVKQLSYSPHGVGRQYAANSDAVKIQYSPYTNQESQTTLIYKGAKIVSQNNCNLLVLPTTQEVGNICGRVATIGARLGEIDQGLQLTHSTGAISVSLGPTPIQPNSAGFVLVGDIDCSSISPNLQALGLERLDVGFVGKHVQQFHEKSPDRNPKVTTIPELKLVVRFKSRLYSAAKQLLLPLHHLPSRSNLGLESEDKRIGESHANGEPGMLVWN